MSDPAPSRPPARTAVLLGWSLGVFVVACLITLWATFSLVTYNVDDVLGSYFACSAVGVLAVLLNGLAVRQFFISPGEGSDEVFRGRRLLTAGVIVTLIAAAWLLWLAN